jgi:hypothetical protein
MHVCPATNCAWHREHFDFLRTCTRFGLPLVLPIKDGTGPLGLTLFIVGLRPAHTLDESLEQAIKII